MGVMVVEWRERRVDEEDLEVSDGGNGGRMGGEEG